jgi:phage/plasmid-associated DNA primase
MYCKSSNAEEKQNIICDKVKTSICCYDGKVYFYHVHLRVFKEVGDGKDKDHVVLKSLLESYVRNSMLVLTRRPVSALPDAEDESHKANRAMLEHAAKDKKFEKAINELNNYSPKNVQAFKFKLSLPVGLEIDSDLNGIHFMNGRLDVHTFQFSERELPNFSKPETFVTKFIQYEFCPFVKENCDHVYDRLLMSFGTREKLDYCLAYAGAALSGNSAVGSCSAMFHVGVGGSGKTSFVDWIKAAVGEAYYKDLPLSTFDSIQTATRAPCTQLYCISRKRQWRRITVCSSTIRTIMHSRCTNRRTSSTWKP